MSTATATKNGGKTATGRHNPDQIAGTLRMQYAICIRLHTHFEQVIDPLLTKQLEQFMVELNTAANDLGGNRTPAAVASTLRTQHKAAAKLYRRLDGVIKPSLLEEFAGVMRETSTAQENIDAWRTNQKEGKASAGKGTGPPGNGG